MEHNKPDQGHQIPGKGSQGQRPGDEERVEQSTPDRSQADDRGAGARPRPGDHNREIPELDEPDVEGVGNEGRGNDLGRNRDQRSPQN